MKSFLYKLFALIFNIGRLLPVRCARAVLLSPHPGEKYDSLSAVKEYLTNTGRFEICEISVPHKRTRLPEYFRFFIVAPVKLARAGYIFLNDNFMPLADLNLSRKTRVIQLWHGEGAFKKFGLLIEQSEEIKSRLIKCTGKTDYIICTSENVRGVYAEAFGARKDKVIALGSARNDYLINLDKAKTRKEFEIKYPQIKDKKLILYAPTFRDDAEKDSVLLDNTDFPYLSKALGNDYIILLKLHPAIHSSAIPEGVVNVTGENITELTVISDMLITDYSSVCMNFAYLRKPAVFYAFDLDEYNDARSFCFGYEDYVPGPVIKDFRELPEIIKNPPNSEKIREFGEFNFKYFDNNNTKRIIEYVIKNS